MKIRQVVVLANPSQVASSIPSGLTQLGLQISDRFYPNDSGMDSLLLCDPGFENTPNGSAILRQALSLGCCVLMDPQSHSSVLGEIIQTGEICEETRRNLSAYVLYRCIESDARTLHALQNAANGMPRYVVNAFEKVQDLRYGENWHQRAALYRRSGALGLHRATKLNGREMSYNNVVDAEAVLEMLIDLSQYDGIKVDKHLSVIVKHANPCGVAYGESQEEAYRLSFATDPKSAFGGVIGFNRPVDEQTASAIGNSFVEVLLAPGYEPKALQILMDNKPNRRILDIGDLLEEQDLLYSGYYLKNIFGGIMLQDYDRGDLKEWRIVTMRRPTDSETRALRFAWKIAKYVKSNALVYTTENQTRGIGSGQVSRVDSARFGAEKALEHDLCTVGTVAATDSFFPFRDGLDMTFEAGATAVIHPGGSIRDEEVINAANEHNMAMVFTGMRHFRH
jgi:phosphoribosylaminoimidazolecarboxamide formyltransferase / IMP cyclohydrolase